MSSKGLPGDPQPQEEGVSLDRKLLLEQEWPADPPPAALPREASGT